MLIVSLPTLRQPQAEWDFVLSDARARIIQSGQAQLALLPKSEAEVVGVIPWQQLSWHPVQVPSSAKRMLTSRNASGSTAMGGGVQNLSKAQILMQGLLEEQILQDITSLHWVARPSAIHRSPKPSASTATASDSSSTLWVACCDKNWLRQSLQTLEASGITVQRLVPELEPTQDETPRWFIVNTGGGLNVVVCTPQSVAGIKEEAFRAMQALHRSKAPLATSTTESWELDPSQAHIVSTPECISAASELLGLTPELQTKAQRLLLASLSEWDFAQGEWAQGSARRWWKSTQKSWQVFWRSKEYQWARWGFMGVLGLQLLALNAWSWHQTQEMQAKTLAMRNLFQSTFPNVPVVIDPLAQMKRELEHLRQAKALASPGDFERLLEVLGQLQPSTSTGANVPLSEIRSLRFTPQELHVVFANDAAVPPALTLPQALLERGYQIKPTDARALEWTLSWRPRP